MEKLMDYLENLMIEENWLHAPTANQARALFTTICLVYDVQPDTMECDKILRRLYDIAALYDLISYDGFESFMTEYLY